MAELLKIKLGSAVPFENNNNSEDDIFEMNIKGRDLVDGFPKSIVITSQEIREALTEPLKLVVESVKETLENTPPELSADILERGITLTGGGALLRGIDTLISEETNMPVIIAQNPLECVAIGTGEYLNFPKTQRITISKRVK